MMRLSIDFFDLCAAAAEAVGLFGLGALAWTVTDGCELRLPSREIPTCIKPFFPERLWRQAAFFSMCM